MDLPRCPVETNIPANWKLMGQCVLRNVVPISELVMSTGISNIIYLVSGYMCVCAYMMCIYVCLARNAVQLPA